MAETTTVTGTAALSTSNMLFDGDFIDLTSESEVQQNGSEEMVDVPHSQTEISNKSIEPQKKLQSINTKEATMIVSSTKTSQKIRFPVKLATNLNGTHILVHQSVGREIGQLFSHNKNEKIATAVKGIPPQLKGGSSGKKSQNFSILENCLQKPADKSHIKFPSKAATSKKLGSKANINPVAVQRYRTIKAALPTSKISVSSNSSQNMNVDDVILVPTASETGFQEVTNTRNQDIHALNSTTKQSSLVPSQSEQTVKKTVSTSTSLTYKSQGAMLSSPQSLQNLNLSSNNDDDDVIVISDDPKVEETKKPKEIQTVLTLPVNVLKQGQLRGVSSRVNELPQKTVLMQKESEDEYVFLAPQPPPPNRQAKGVTLPRSPNINVQNVKVIMPPLNLFKKSCQVAPPVEHPAKALLKTLQQRQSHHVGVKDTKNLASTLQELEIVEQEIASNSLTDLQNLRVPAPVAAIAENVDGKEMVFLVYSVPDESSAKALEVADADNCTVIPDDDDDIELGEPKVEPVFDDVIETEKDDPFQHIQAATIDQSCVTPVDIAQILKQGEMERRAELKERCESVALKNMKLYNRGFTKREMRRANCVKYLQAFIKKEENKIRELKKSCFDKSHFIHCGRSFNNFLPETSQCDEGDRDEYVIEYNDIEQRLEAEIYNSRTLPVITNVISKVNEEVLHMKEQHTRTRKRQDDDLQAKLAKPEEALELIKRGLELIKSWSQETHLSKERANKSLPAPSPKKKTTNVVEPKRKRHSTPIEVVVEPPKRGRRKKNEVVQKEEAKVKTVRKRTLTEKAAEAAASNEKATKASVTEVKKRKTEVPVEVKSPKKRGRKPKNRIDFDSVDDNELFVIKKVDILNGKRRK